MSYQYYLFYSGNKRRKPVSVVVFHALFSILLILPISLSAQDDEESTEAVSVNDSTIVASTVLPASVENPLTNIIDQSDTIVSESDKVELVEDSNVAEALKRRPDLKFNNIKVDGEASDVSLDDISADAVENIEVMKAVTPDLDASSRGGSLSMRSKPSYEMEKPLRQGSVEIEWQSIWGEPEYEFSLTYGDKLGQSGNHGYRATGTWKDGIDGSEGIFANWMEKEINGQQQWVHEYFTVNRYKESFTQNSINGTYDFRLNEAWSFFLKATGSAWQGVTYHPNLTFRYNEEGATCAQSPGNDQEIMVNGVTIKRDTRGWEGYADDASLVAGGYYETKSVEADFRLGHRYHQYEEPDYFTIDFANSGVALAYDTNDPVYTAIRPENEAEVFDTDAFEFSEMLSQHWLQKKNENYALFNFKRKHGIGSTGGFFKFGSKVHVEEFDQLSDTDMYTDFDGEYTISDVASPYLNNGLLDDHYEHGQFAGLEESRAFFREHFDQFYFDEVRSRESSDPSTFKVKETISSFYGMGNFIFGKFRTIVGFRGEKTSIEYKANELVIDEINGQPVFVSSTKISEENSYSHLFPNIHARYRFSERLSVIGSYTETISRPNYNQVVPYRYVNRENLEIDEGNPELGATTYNNWDLAVDYHIEGSTLLSVELFQRKVNDPIEFTEVNLTSGPYAGYELNRNQNGTGSSLQGLELTWDQQWHKWTPWIPEGVSSNINYTFQDAGETLLYTPDHQWKVTLVYDRGPVYAQMEWNHVNQSMTSVNADDERYNRYRAEIDTIELSVSYKFNDKYRIVVELENVTNAPADHYYQGQDNRTVQYFYNPWRAEVALKWDL